jgi:hypothetical protein
MGMGDIIRMKDSESVREMGRMLGRLGEKILGVQTEISRAAQGMDWDSSAKDYFLQDVEIWAGKMYGFSQRCDEKGTAVIREADQWETAAAQFGGGLTRYTPFVVGPGDTTAVDETDIHQGGIGDCYLMSSLGALALTRPELLEEMIEVLPDGRYKVRFYDKWCLTIFGPCTYTEHYVIVDADFEDKLSDPVDKIGDTQEAWTMIIEKAYDQWKKERAFLGDPTVLLPSPAVALSAITGQDCVNYPTALMTMDDLYQKFQQGDAITAGGKWPTDPTRPLDKMFGEGVDVPKDTDLIREGHVYFVTNVDPVANTVTVQNPWGPDWDPITMSFEEYQACFWLTTTNPGQ